MPNVIQLNTAQKSLRVEQVKAIIVQHLSKLRRFAYSLTQNMHDADDLVQLVVERMLNNPMPESVEPLAWLFRVCKNAWVDELRFRAVRKQADSTEMDNLEQPENSESALNQLAQRDLHRAIDQLPEVYAMVLRLIVVSGLSYAEVAQTLDIPLGTVMSRISRAREQLADKLRTE